MTSFSMVINIVSKFTIAKTAISPVLGHWSKDQWTNWIAVHDIWRNWSTEQNKILCIGSSPKEQSSKGNSLVFPWSKQPESHYNNGNRVAEEVFRTFIFYWEEIWKHNQCAIIDPTAVLLSLSLVCIYCIIFECWKPGRLHGPSYSVLKKSVWDFCGRLSQLDKQREGGRSESHDELTVSSDHKRDMN